MSQIPILAPVVRQKKGTYQQLFKDLDREGYARVRVDGMIHQSDDEILLERYVKHKIVIDRLRVPEGRGQHRRRFVAYRVAGMRRVSKPLDIGRVATIGVLAMFLWLKRG